jgi:CTP:molybdopterin cytidylyltransferase MocA
VDTIAIAGIVLAAGASRRMGKPKALLTSGPEGETFAARNVRILSEGGANPVFVVGRPDDDPLRTQVGVAASAEFLVNPSPERGQLSSLLVGIEAAESRRVGGVLVLPVDIPMVRSDTIRSSIAAFLASRPPILRVTHGGRHGHPVIFAARVFADLRRADAAVGAKDVLRAYGNQVLDFEVDDPGVLRDVDVVEDYRRLFGREPW